MASTRVKGMASMQTAAKCSMGELYVCMYVVCRRYPLIFKFTSFVNPLHDIHMYKTVLVCYLHAGKTAIRTWTTRETDPCRNHACFVSRVNM